MPAELVSLPHARLVFNEERVPYSEEFADVYHSAAGGPEQSRHVFIQGCGLPGRWRNHERYCIVETGFGLGLNFLQTWEAFEEDRNAPARLHFVSVESHPCRLEDLSRAHARWPWHERRSQALLSQWPLPLKGFHRLQFASGRVVLTLLLGDALGCLRELEARADAIYLDGFAPARNPDMWTAALFAQLARLSHAGTQLATWSVAGRVRTGLQGAGFATERRPGFAGKREMLVARFQPPGPVAAPPSMPDRAIVIGAGLAGTACAQALAGRGVTVTVLERHAGPAAEASGNPQGLCAPLLNPGDAPNARLSRAAFLHACRHYRSLDLASGAPLPATGSLRILRDEREAQRYRQLLEERGFPAQFARFVPAPEMATHAGHASARAGIWFAQALALDPRRACRQQLESPRIDVRFGSSVQRIERDESGWHALAHTGQAIASAPVLVVATACDSAALVPNLPLQRVRGQVSILSWPARAALRCPVSGESYALMLPDGRLLAGATFQPDDPDEGVRPEDHALNLRHLAAAFPGLAPYLAAPDSACGAIEGRVGFRSVTPDRLPALGPVAPGLYLCTGLGARGLCWAPLGAEWLASVICHDPLPLPGTLGQALAATRFAAKLVTP